MIIHKQKSKPVEGAPFGIRQYSNLCGVPSAGNRMNHHWKFVTCEECLKLKKRPKPLVSEKRD